MFEAILATVHMLVMVLLGGLVIAAALFVAFMVIAMCLYGLIQGWSK